ncbi:Gamma-aminobutyric acid (GABA) B receptor [Seminavis robusta]|uniref:Gamma-aminobutyric acid (GABA) B receptor n=1 Tax=Seminavis robusta TaxID=568900 RepID=A0A9N8F5Z3_9STRA|nr:Gamma-aminobutyric acid (GABA) B receptor [Seminavis robusta]|eukprot:Sro3802_g351180.1 Gamma-aminobutyric acid (GABA) B receptor (367) ;mRNA; r:201-1477
MNYMQEWWVSIGILLVVLQFVFSILFSAWTFCYREHPIIKASQPQFLWMIAFGCCVMVTKCHYSHVATRRISPCPKSTHGTGDQYTQSGNCKTRCGVHGIAVDGLACLGFTIIFSALFAKIWRIKKIHSHAERFRRQEVMIRDVISIMVVMLVVETAVLLTWSLVDPLQWNRTVLTEDADGYPIESAGSCSSDSTVYFLSTLAVFKGGSLLYALYLRCMDHPSHPFGLSRRSMDCIRYRHVSHFWAKVVEIHLDGSQQSMDMSLVVRKSAMNSSTIPNPQYVKRRISRDVPSPQQLRNGVRKSHSVVEAAYRIPSSGEFENNDSEPDNVEMALQPLECASNDDAEDARPMCPLVRKNRHSGLRIRY